MPTCIHFCPKSFTCKFIAMNHWSGSMPLASKLLILGTHSDSSMISCCCHVSWRSWSFDSANYPIHMLPREGMGSAPQSAKVSVGQSQLWSTLRHQEYQESGQDQKCLHGQRHCPRLFFSSWLWTQTCLLEGAPAKASLWPQVAAQATHIRL